MGVSLIQLCKQEQSPSVHPDQESTITVDDTPLKRLSLTGRAGLKNHTQRTIYNEDHDRRMSAGLTVLSSLAAFYTLHTIVKESAYNLYRMNFKPFMSWVVVYWNIPQLGGETQTKMYC